MTQHLAEFCLEKQSRFITSNCRQIWRPDYPDYPTGLIVSGFVGGVYERIVEHISIVNKCLYRSLQVKHQEDYLISRTFSLER